MHHRMPTSTDNVRNACHPFSTKKFFKHNYILVHNGVISNAWTLKQAHEELGISYISVQPETDRVKYQKWNDSEGLLWDVALMLEGKQDGLKSIGSIAFILVENDGKGKALNLYFARNTYPLNMDYRPKDHLYLSSEGIGKPIEAGVLYRYNYASGKLTQAPLTFPLTPAQQTAITKAEENARWETYHPGAREPYKFGQSPIKTPKEIKEEEAIQESIEAELEYNFLMGQALAQQVLTDNTSMGDVIETLHNSLDSLVGQIETATQAIMTAGYTSPTGRRLNRDRAELFQRREIVTEALEVVTGDEYDHYYDAVSESIDDAFPLPTKIKVIEEP